MHHSLSQPGPQRSRLVFNLFRSFQEDAATWTQEQVASPQKIFSLEASRDNLNDINRIM